jgi:hypothetical protein
MHKSTPTQILIDRVTDIKYTPKGNAFLECFTNMGVVAFWGRPGNMPNIHLIQDSQLPCTVLCDTISASPRWVGHALWVPESSTIRFLNAPDNPIKQNAQPKDAAAASNLSVEDLAKLRRSVMQIIVELEKKVAEADPHAMLGHRIRILSKCNAIPPEISAMMRTVTEMRNAAEYRHKVLNDNESAAVRHAWIAIQDWWRRTQ